MIIAIPHIPARTDYKKLAEAIETQGNNENHILLFSSAGTEDVSNDAAEFFDRVKPFFKKAFMVLLPAVDVSVGFNLPNTHFAVCASWAAGYLPEAGEFLNPPVLYLDPAAYPAEPNWADITQAAYLKSNGRFFGSTETLPNQVLSNGMTTEGGKRFNSSVVFDQKFAAASALINYLRPDESWRTTLRWEMTASHTASDFLVSGGPYKVAGDTKPKKESKKTAGLDEVETTTPEQKLEIPKVSGVSSSNGVRRIELD